MSRVITNREINLAYIKDKPYRVKPVVNAHGLSPIMHMFLLNASCTAFSKYIKAKNFTFKDKKVVKEVEESYSKFFTYFWLPFDEAQHDHIDAKLTEYEELIDDYLNKLIIAATQMVNWMPDEQRNLVASATAANKLAVDAAVAFNSAYLPLEHSVHIEDGANDPIIDNIIKGTYRLARKFGLPDTEKLFGKKNPTDEEAKMKKTIYKHGSDMNQLRKAIINKTQIWVVDDYHNDVEEFMEGIKNKNIEAPKSNYFPGCLLNGARLRIRTSIL